MISGMINAIIALIISNISLKLLLKRCLIDDSNNTSNTFEYKGKTYDKSKYINERCNKLNSLNKKQIKTLIKETKEEIEKGKHIELQKAELEALELTFDTKYPNKNCEENPTIESNLNNHNADNNSTENIKTPSDTSTHIVKVKARKTKVSEEKPKTKKSMTSFKTATIILSVTTTVFIVSTAILSINLVNMNSKINELNSTVNDLELTIEQKENTNNLLRDQIDNLNQKLSTANEKIRIYEGRPSSEEIQEKVRNGEYNFNFE